MSVVSDMSDGPAAEPGEPSIEWWSIPEVAAALGIRDREVRSMISERSLVAVRHGGRAPVVPARLIVPAPERDGSAVVAGLRGTVTLLADAGYDDAETVAWLFRHNDELGSTPLDALVALRTHAVRRAAQGLAF